jgi:16S rRNA (guanine527-N7)-methyltransferase
VKRAPSVESGHPPDTIASEVIGLLETSPELRGLGLPRAFLSRMRQFAAVLALWGSRANLTGSPQSAVDISFHIIDSLAPLWAGGGALFEPGEGFEKMCRAADLGSGAGFPGLVLAAATPARFTLLESRRKRASFLTVAAAEMRLRNVTVRWERARSGEGERNFDIVTSRAVGGSSGTIALASSLLRSGGLAIFYAGAGQVLDLARSERAGFSMSRTEKYEIARGRERVARSLIVLRKRG